MVTHKITPEMYFMMLGKYTLAKGKYTLASRHS